MWHAASMPVVNASASASGNCRAGTISSGSMWAAIEATLTIAAPSPAVPKKTSLTLSVPSALVLIT
jgi:hypothetical protein